MSCGSSYSKSTSSNLDNLLQHFFKFIQKATAFEQHLANIHIATRQVQAILQKFMNADVTAHKCSDEKWSSVCSLYCNGILHVMTSDTFVSGVKSVTTLAVRGGEGWVMETVCRWLNKAGQSPLCSPAGWWCALGHICVLHTPFPAEWASTYRKQVLVVPGRTVVGTRWNRAPESMDDGTVQDHGLPLFNIDRPTSWLACVHTGKLWQK